MMYVIKRQPWLVRRQNLLIEMYDPKKPFTYYRFKYMYTNVRLYGIPREIRSVDKIHEILNQIGQPTDLEQLVPSSLPREEFL